MWLLDVNLPTGLLAEAAFGAGFRVILTRDRLFGESASRALGALPELAVVVVTLSQARAAAYLSEFRARWEQRPIEPVAGGVVEWP